MESVKNSLEAMAQLFNKRMNEFQNDLQKANPAAVTVNSLATEFSTFKVFILTTLDTLQKQIQYLGRDVDRLEMRGRRKMLLLHGVPETDSEDTTLVDAGILSEKLNVARVSAASFSRCHRLGRSTGKKPRPVVVKFREAPVRDKIWYSKAKLKGTGITLSEFLTKTRHRLFMDARQRFGVKQCWTRDGQINILAPDGSHHQVNSLAELDAVPRTPPAPVSPVPVVADIQKVQKEAPLDVYFPPSYKF